MYKRLATDLVKIFNDNAYLSIVLDNAITELKLSLNDKKVYTKVLYGVVENKMMIDYNLSPLIKGKRVKPFIKNILRIGVYVMLTFLEAEGIKMNCANEDIVDLGLSVASGDMKYEKLSKK